MVGSAAVREKVFDAVGSILGSRTSRGGGYAEVSSPTMLARGARPTNHSGMSYEGNDRRRHRLIVTRNTEYHLKDDVCVAVRDRNTKKWQVGHLAVSLRVQGGVRFFDNGAVVPSLEAPGPGDAMFFTYKSGAGSDRQLVTSRIEAVARTPKKDVLTYATLGAATRQAAQKPS